MEVIISLDKLLFREKEIFDTFTSHGREEDLMPLLNQYGLEDKKVYNIDKAYKYLLLYISSNNISKDELTKFNEYQKLDPLLIFKRGKKTIQTLIKSNNDEKQLYLLAATFAENDGRVNPYPISYVKKALEYYITHSKNHEIIDTYYTIVELTKNSTKQEFDIDLIKELIKLNDINNAVTFIKNINISDVRLENLINTYCILYPANTGELMYIRQLMNLYRDGPQNKIIPKKETDRRMSIKELKRVLEDFLISDTEDIKEILTKHELSEYEFNEGLKDAIIQNDPILSSLIDKYKIKNQVLTEYRDSIISNIGNSIINGINYGNGYREYNIYDFLIQRHSFDNKTIFETIKELFNKNDSERIINTIINFDLTSKYTSIEDLSSSIGVFSKNGRSLTDEEKRLILSFIKENQLPINNSVFFAICERYFDDDLVISNKKVL